MIDALHPPIAPPMPASHGAPAPSESGRDDFSQALDAAQRRPEEAPDAAAEGTSSHEAAAKEARTSDADAAQDPAREPNEADDEEVAAPPPVDLSALLPGWPPSPPAVAAAPGAGADAALEAVAAGSRAAKPALDTAATLPDAAAALPNELAPHDAKGVARPEAALSADPGAHTADLPATARNAADPAAPLSMPSFATPAGAPANAAPSTPAAPFQAHLAAAVDTPAFAPSLGATLSLLARDGVQHAQLSLHPAELGPVAVQIAVDGTQARIDFHAAHAATRAALEAALPDLAAALRDSGLTLAGGGVFDQSPKRQAEQAQHGTRKEPDRDEPLIKHTPQLLRPRGVVDLYA